MHLAKKDLSTGVALWKSEVQPGQAQDKRTYYTKTAPAMMRRKQAQATRSHRWTFTIQAGKTAPDQDDGIQEALEAASKNARYIIWQWEKAPTTGQYHVQGYVEWENQKTMNATKVALGDKGAHVEQAQGTAKQNKEYCSKSETKVQPDMAREYGAYAEQGKRNDWWEIKEDIKDGMGLRDIAEKRPDLFAKHYSGITALMKTLQTPPRRHPVSIFYWTGIPGVGKTHWTTKTFDDQDPTGDHSHREAYWVQDRFGSGPPWMDGYTDQLVCVFDEFDGQMPRNTMLRIMDGQPTTVQNKGGSAHFKASVLVLLSNDPITEMYKEHCVGERAWARRLREFGIDLSDENAREWVSKNIDDIIKNHWNAREKYDEYCARMLINLDPEEPYQDILDPLESQWLANEELWRNPCSPIKRASTEIIDLSQEE